MLYRPCEVSETGRWFAVPRAGAAWHWCRQWCALSVLGTPLSSRHPLSSTCVCSACAGAGDWVMSGRGGAEVCGGGGGTTVLESAGCSVSVVVPVVLECGSEKMEFSFFRFSDICTRIAENGCNSVEG
jgi:hypothetical protein